MLKNAFTALVIGSVLFLTGCGQEAVVTEKMLIGKWECHVVKSITTEYDGNDVIAGPEERSIYKPVSFRHYFKENNTMMTILDNGQSRPFVFKNKKIGEFNSFDDGSKMKIDHEYIFVTKDQFKHVLDVTILPTDLFDWKIENHQEKLCSRITAE